MVIHLEIGLPASVNRRASVTLAPEEIRSISLSVAFGEKRNRTGLYMRRHPKAQDAVTGTQIDPNRPLRSPDEPVKLTIPEHLKRLGAYALETGPAQETEHYSTCPALLAVPVSDLVANLLRPSFNVRGFGDYRTFFLEDEPVERRTYWAACFFLREPDQPVLEFRDVRFDPHLDTVRSLDGTDLAAEGLQWAAALVPLVKDGKPVPPVEIAKSDYDLRQILGRSAEKEIAAAYGEWYDGWESAVERLVEDRLASGRPFEVFYHSVLGIDRSGAIRLYQRDADLPGLAEALVADGIVSAGLLDSGGSCALYDPWLEGYLNHGWYFREPRGAILLFELKARERIPEPRPGSWTSRRSAEDKPASRASS